MKLCVGSFESFETSCKGLAAASGRSRFAGRAEAEDALRGLLAGLPEAERDALLDRLTATLDADDLVRLLVCAPFHAPTWRRLDRQDPAIGERYWREAVPDGGPSTPDERATLIDRLLAAARPRAAFDAVHLTLEDIDSARLQALLIAVATVTAEPPERHQLSGYDLAKAIEILAARPDASSDVLARLELIYADVLDHSEHGIPNLERWISQNPAEFVRLVALAFRRSDGAADPPGLVPADPAARRTAAERGFRVLERLRRIPGTQPDGTIDAATLVAWIEEVRRLCHEHGRAAIGDDRIGDLLAKAPADPDGIWPCRAVAEALDAVATKDLRTGFRTGVYNARGVVARGAGGDEERALAARYRGWADAHRFDWPFTASVLDALATSYERDAVHWDHDAAVRRRLER